MAEASQFAELKELVTLIKNDKVLGKQYEKANADQRRELIQTIQDVGEKSNADNISMHKEMVSMEKEAAKDRKSRSAKDTREAFTLRKQLYDKDIKDEGFLSRAESDRASGLKIDMESVQSDYENYKLRREYEKRDEQKKAEDLKKEDRKIALAEKSLQSLKGQLEQLGLNQEFAERMAKKAMQMKEAVGAWFEDKKEGMKKMGKSLLEWLMKAGGLFLLYKFFDFLSKTNLKELYDIMVTAMDVLITGFRTLGGWLGGIKVFKWINDFFKVGKGWTAFVNFWKGIGGKITKGLKAIKLGGIITAIGALFKAGGAIFKFVFKAFGGGASLKVWEGIIAAIKGVFKMITGPFGKEGGIGKAFAKISKFLQMIPGMKILTKFAGGILKFMARFFAPVLFIWGIVESVIAGFTAAEEETGGLGQKILTFLQVGLQTLLDFFIFDLAQMVEDGIKWGIKWVMGLFGFSEEEQKAATDWSIVGAVRDAIFKAIDWVRDLFRFDGKGISFKGLAPLIDIIMFPLNLAINWVRGLFGWDKDKDGNKKKFSIGDLITDALDSIFAFMKEWMNPKKILEKLNPLNWFGGDDSKEDIQKEIADLQAENARDNSRGSAGRIKRREKEISELEAKLEKMATGGTILPGGAAIVGEGSMAGELVVNANSAARVIPARETAMMQAGVSGGGDTIAPTIINSSNAETTMVANSSSHNPYSDKYFRN